MPVNIVILQVDPRVVNDFGRGKWGPVEVEVVQPDFIMDIQIKSEKSILKIVFKCILMTSVVIPVIRINPARILKIMGAELKTSENKHKIHLIYRS